jgi:hypothetical protein
VTSIQADTAPHATAQPGGWRGFWSPKRARLALFTAIALSWLLALGMPAGDWFDFPAFYAAGGVAFTAGVVDLEAISLFQVENGLPEGPWVYPAGVALLYAPFTALPFGVAAALHFLLMLALLLLAALAWATLSPLPRQWLLVGTLAWGPAALGVIAGQNTSLALLLVAVTAWALLHGRDGLAGTASGLLAYKPQFAAPLVGLLLVRGRWRALLFAAVVLALHWLLGVVATGGQLDWPVAWLKNVDSYQEADFLANGWKAISLPSFGRQLENLIGVPGLTIAGYLIAGVIVIACLPALRRLPAVDAVALAAALGLLISPHAWAYDAALLLPAVAVFAARAAARGWRWQDRWWLALAYAIAVAWPLTMPLGFTLIPLLLLAAPLALLERGPFRVASS